jgi:hypothetical protein
MKEGFINATTLQNHVRVKHSAERKLFLLVLEKNQETVGFLDLFFLYFWNQNLE